MTQTLEEITQFKSYFDSCPNAVFLCDGTTIEILSANRQAYRLTGLPKTELCSRSLPDLLLEEDRAGFTEAWKRASSTSAQSPGFAILKVPGAHSPLPVEWHRSAVETPDAERYIVTLRELTAVSSVSEDARLRTAALESVHCGVTIADARLHGMPLIYVNKGFELITGYTSEDSLGRSCNFLQGLKRDQPEVDIIRTALRNGDACDVRLQNFRKNGEAFWNELILSPVKDSQGHLTHYIGIQIDVSDKVYSRLLLQESEARYRALAESVEDIIIMTSTGGQIQFCSPSMERVSKVTPEAWSGRSFSELLDNDDDRSAYDAILSRLRKKDITGHRYEFLLRDRHGEETWMDTNMTLVTDPKKGDYIVSVLRDITLKKKAKDEINSSLLREKELSQLKSNFIRIVSHEFRTPMTGIRASNAFLQEYGAGLSSEKASRHYQNIDRSLTRMNRLLDDVLFISRDESAHLSVQPETVRLSEHTETLIEETRFIFPRRTIIVEDSLKPDATVQTDPHLLRHILYNLLGNALKYSPSESEVLLRLASGTTAQTIRWSIHDKGIGIPENDQKRLFEAFQRGENVSTIQGTGLGLFIAKRSADLLGGRIHFKSKQSHGSDFFFELPIPAES